MIAAQLTHLDKPAARALCLQFILHEYARALEIASTFSSTKDLSGGIEKLYPDLVEGMPVLKLGILRKLCFYCEALLEHSDKGEDLLHALDELQLSAARARRKHDAASELYQKLRAFFPLLYANIQECKECEAPLFTLLELRKTFNFHLGEETIEQLLEKLFSSPQEMRQTIAQGFSQRGFDAFYKQNKSLFEGVTWKPSATKR